VSAELTIQRIFEISTDIRYVAVRMGDVLELQQRSSVADGSAPDSDRYEELLVNPTVLGLTRERGRIDCDGLDFVLIRYGKFYQLVYPILGGHVSIAIAPSADPLAIVEPVRTTLAQAGLLPESSNRGRSS
jgi:hypothetical protein